jgi:trehalose 6-phosphate phosphatase
MAQPLPLWQHLQVVLQRLITSEWCALLLDYDGTLTPIVTDPATAYLSPAMQQILTALVYHPRYQIAIVSGRALADLQGRAEGLALYMAGNHGLQIAGPEIEYCHPEAVQMQPQLRTLTQELQQALETIPGAWVEDKGLTLTVHMRKVPTAYVPLVQRRVLRLIRPALEARALALRTGKAVLEVRPAIKWDKGSALRWIVDHMCLSRSASHMCPIYIGDDETDEDAFQALGTAGLRILVGCDRLSSAAHYYVESVEQAMQFLAMLRGLAWRTQPCEGCGS